MSKTKRNPDVINIWEGEAPAEPKKKSRLDGSLALPNHLNGYPRLSLIKFLAFAAL